METLITKLLLYFIREEWIFFVAMMHRTTKQAFDGRETSKRNRDSTQKLVNPIDEIAQSFRLINVVVSAILLQAFIICCTMSVHEFRSLNHEFPSEPIFRQYWNIIKTKKNN